jgi:predicted dehydrogenase
MAVKFAFMGFRHFHVLALYEKVQNSANAQIVAACEEDSDGAKLVPDSVTLTHDNYEKMLDEVDCDVIAIGDYYGRRGSIIIEALKRGKHVLSDKPVCTSLDELDQIEKLATENGLAVGCQLDMVNSKNMHVLKRLVDDGSLGDLHQIYIGGQHPLNYGTRPMWYFEDGKHGGTINDIAIHAVHTLPWITGLKLTDVVAARTWNAFATECPAFNDSAQAMITMSNGCGFIMDVSYAMPNSHGYTMPQYWRTTLFGTGGVAETSNNVDHIWFARQGNDKPEIIPIADVDAGCYLEDYLAEIAGNSRPPLTTAQVIAATRQTLLIQQAADQNTHDTKL